MAVGSAAVAVVSGEKCAVAVAVAVVAWTVVDQLLWWQWLSPSWRSVEKMLRSEKKRILGNILFLARARAGNFVIYWVGFSFVLQLEGKSH